MRPLNKPGWWTAAKMAQQVLQKQRIDGCLVGTAALFVLDFSVPYQDLDFICYKAPTGPDFYDLIADPKYHDKCTSVVWDFDTEFYNHDVHINFITAGKRGLPNDVHIVDGVCVAPLQFILDLKRRADRPKDRSFFLTYPGIF